MTSSVNFNSNNMKPELFSGSLSEETNSTGSIFEKPVRVLRGEEVSDWNTLEKVVYTALTVLAVVVATVSLIGIPFVTVPFVQELNRQIEELKNFEPPLPKQDKTEKEPELNTQLLGPTPAQFKLAPGINIARPDPIMEKLNQEVLLKERAKRRAIVPYNPKFAEQQQTKEISNVAMPTRSIVTSRNITIGAGIALGVGYVAGKIFG